MKLKKVKLAKATNPKFVKITVKEGNIKALKCGGGPQCNEGGR